MTWDEAIRLLGGADWKGVKAGLDRIRELLALLGDPQTSLRFVHVAGTNGKGSACAMLAEILMRAGCRTGRYISPHLVRVNERFAVDGRDITDAEFVENARIVRACAEKMNGKPTVFELLTALAFLYFQKKHCEIVVLEVGLGGRLDATNVIGAPLVALLMHIGLEHTAELGGTIGQIAFEKAGIIKEDSDVVLSAQSAEAEDIVRRLCVERRARLTVTDPAAITVRRQGMTAQQFSYRGRNNLRLSLLGVCQTENAAAVLDAVDILKDRHGIPIPEEAVRAGLSSVRWPGRFQVLRRDPLFVLDGAHNPNGVQALAESIRLYFAGRRLILLMGVMADKNYVEMLDILAASCGGDQRAGGSTGDAAIKSDPLEKCGGKESARIVRFIALSPAEARALSPDALKKEIGARFSCPVEACGSTEEGLRRAFAAAEQMCGADPEGIILPAGKCPEAERERPADDRPVILALGSLYQAGEILRVMESGESV